ncbi:MAG: hypothetical protein IJH34_04705 [Romboutsia sp.]|nr:hypothetical protein [Romboutsia sp.]
MGKNKTNKKNVLSIVLYVVAAILAIYSVYKIYDTYNYVNALVAYGSVDPSTQMADIVNYYISAVSTYAFYAIVVWALGYIISKLNTLTNALTSNNTTETVESEDVKSSDEVLTIMEEEPIYDEGIIEEVVLENPEEDKKDEE